MINEPIPLFHLNWSNALNKLKITIICKEYKICCYSWKMIRWREKKERNKHHDAFLYEIWKLKPHRHLHVNSSNQHSDVSSATYALLALPFSLSLFLYRDDDNDDQSKQVVCQEFPLKLSLLIFLFRLPQEWNRR